MRTHRVKMHQDGSETGMGLLSEITRIHSSLEIVSRHGAHGNRMKKPCPVNTRVDKKSRCEVHSRITEKVQENAYIKRAAISRESSYKYKTLSYTDSIMLRARSHSYYACSSETHGRRPYTGSKEGWRKTASREEETGMFNV